MSPFNIQGRYRVDRLIPGVPYDITIFRPRSTDGTSREVKTLQPGETRIIDDIRLQNINARR